VRSVAAPAVFHVVEYGAVVASALSALPSRRNCTPMIAVSSDASAVTATVPATVASFAGFVGQRREERRPRC
jgi:hypothetical protein